MKKSFKQNLKRYFNFANSVIFIGIITVFIYTFSYLFPVTDNAFVVNNVRPVAALVQGYITNIYIKNGDHVTQGQKLFTVFNEPYIYTVEQYKAELNEANSKLIALQKNLERDIAINANQQDIYVKLALDTEKYTQAYKINAVSLKTLQDSEQDTKAAQANVFASNKQIEVDKENIKTQEHQINVVEAKLKYAQVYLDQTTVYAQTNGVIQNFYSSLGTPVNVNQPLFSLVDTDEVYFQANFNETDLTGVKKDSKVLIFPRIYLGMKVFHGVVVSDYWGANRQMTDDRSQIQNVTNENEWILLPQRMPVQIKVTDPDPKYPLRVGTSAYVYISAY